MQKERNIYIDYLKGLLIILVVLGHAIQYIGYGNADAWNNYLYQLIYMFHMPLFIALSGYLAFFSIQKHPITVFLKNKLLYIAVPMLVWCFFMAQVYFFCKNDLNILAFLKEFGLQLDISHWFLKAIIVYSLFVCFLTRFRWDTWFLVVSIILITLFPFRVHFNLDLIISFYPFFVIGYLLGNVNMAKCYQWCIRYIIPIVFVSVVCFFLWNKETYAYNTPSNWNCMPIVLLRLGGGVSVSILFMLVSYFLFQKITSQKCIHTLTMVGQNSLGIYLMQSYVFLPFIIISKSESLNISWFVQVLLITFSPVLCILMSRWMDFVCKNKMLGFIFFGKSIARR
jgi:Fucose 4-O-acetylase and related acetyltransferases